MKAFAFTLGKRLNGHAVIVEQISRGRKSIRPVTAWQNTTEHYLKKYGNNKTQPIDASQLQKGAKRGYKPAVQEAAEVASIGSVSQSVPQVKAETDPLLQAILGDRKQVEQATLSPEQFDGGALPTDADHGMMHKERAVLEYGGEARPESTSDFIRRSLREVHGIHEGRNITFGFRKPVESGISGVAGSIQTELTALGVPGFLADGFVEWNRDGLTRTYSVKEASTYAGEGVFINGMTTMPPKNVAGHEAFHYWKGAEARNVFRDVLLDNLIFSSVSSMREQKAGNMLLGGEGPGVTPLSFDTSSSTSVEGTGPLNVDSGIAQGSEVFKQKDLLTGPRGLCKKMRAPPFSFEIICGILPPDRCHLPVQAPGFRVFVR